MKLLRRLILSFAVFAFLPLVIMAGITLASQSEQLLRTARGELAFLAADTAARVDLLLGRALEQVEQLGASPEIADALTEANRAYAEMEAEQTARLMAERDEAWASASGDPSKLPLLADALGNRVALALRRFQAVVPGRYAEIIVTDAAGGVYAATGPTTDYCQSDEDWWIQARAAAGGPAYVSPVGFDESAGVYSLDVSVPVRDMRGNTVGVLKVVHDVNELFQCVARLGSSGTRRGHLVDAQGNAVFAGAGGQAGRQFDRAVMDALRSRRGGVLVRRPWAGSGRQVVGFASLRTLQTPWSVVVTQATSEVYGASRRALLWGGTVVLLPMAGLVLLALYWRKRLVAPLKALHWAAEQVAASRLDVRVQIEQDDELRDVGYQFNRMAAALQRHEQDQRYEISRRNEELRQIELQAGRIRDATSAQMESISTSISRALDTVGEVVATAAAGSGRAAVAQEAVGTVRASVEDLRDLCRMARGQPPMQMEAVTIGECLDSARRVLTPLLEQNGVRLSTPPEANAWSVTADRARLKQVLYALLSNAVKYGGKGTTVSVSLARQDGGTVVGVLDEGPGNAPEDRGLVFAPLLSRPPSSGPAHERIGLNLAIVRQFVDLHHGKIWIEARPDGGTAFYFSLPGPSAGPGTS